MTLPAVTYLDRALVRQAHAMSERELQNSIRKACETRGYLVMHVEDSLAGRVWLPGWPDLVIVGKTGILYRELKSQRESATRSQIVAGAAINAAGSSWRVWKPSDLLSGRIAVELDGIA